MSDSFDRPSRERYLRTPLASFPFDLQARLVEATSVQDVYEIGVAILARIPATVCIRIFQRDDTGQMVLVHAWQSPLSDPSGVSPEEIGKAVHQRWISTHRVGSHTHEFARPFIHPGQPAWLIVPLMASDELIGAIAAERRDGQTFQYAPEDIIAFSACAAGMSWGIQSLFLRERTDRLGTTPDQDSIDEIISRERRQIGRELHDNVVQNLAYLNMKMEIVSRYVDENPEIAQNEIKAVQELVDKTVVELRRTIGEMRRPVPARRGITGQLRSIARNIEIDASDFEMDLKQVSGVQLIPEVERAAVGIVREALQNVRKHASASSVRLEVTRQDGDLVLNVIDDGVGIEDPNRLPIDHFGMAQMRELAEDLGGDISIVSEPGQGTRVEARLPLVVPAGGTPSSLEGSGLSASEYLSQPPPEPPDFVRSGGGYDAGE